MALDSIVLFGLCWWELKRENTPQKVCVCAFTVLTGKGVCVLCHKMVAIEQTAASLTAHQPPCACKVNERVFSFGRDVLSMERRPVRLCISELR